MFRKSILRTVLAACLMLTPMLARGAGSNSTGTITVNATVDTFAEWSSTTPVTINLGTINSMSGATASHAFTLYSNVDCAIAGSTNAGGNNGVLTSGSYTVPTRYRISGDVTGSANLLAATAFFDAGNTYAVDHVAGDGGSYSVTLEVEALPSGGAPESGSYTCGLTLVASWS
jgi:hypothetical protein